MGDTVFKYNVVYSSLGYCSIRLMDYVRTEFQQSRRVPGFIGCIS